MKEVDEKWHEMQVCALHAYSALSFSGSDKNTNPDIGINPCRFEVENSRYIKQGSSISTLISYCKREAIHCWENSDIIRERLIQPAKKLRWPCVMYDCLCIRFFRNGKQRVGNS